MERKGIGGEMKKRVLCFLWALTASALSASPLDDADVAFYVEDYQKAIDMISEEESSAAQHAAFVAPLPLWRWQLTDKKRS